MSETKHPSRVAAERKTQEILGLIHYDTTSLTHALVKAFRNGMQPEGGEKAFSLIESALKEARVGYQAAIAQPENNVAKRPEVVL